MNKPDIIDHRCMPPQGNEAEIDANAHLISAAPDLLSALENLANYVFSLESKENICSSVWMEARKAIDKAEGRAQ